MAVTETSYTGNGSTTNYSFTFPYLKSTDIQVLVDDLIKTAGTDWSLANATTVQFNSAPADQSAIKIRRQTNVDSLAATFYAGSAIKSEDLNDNATQNIYVAQEINDRYLDNDGATITGNFVLAKDADIIYEGSTANDFETTLTVADPTADRTITLPNVTGTVVTTGDSQSVSTGMITDGTIINGDISASAEIAVSKLKDGTARQLLQTDSGGTGVEWTSNVDVPGTLDVTGATDLDSTLNVDGATTLGTTLGVTGTSTLADVTGGAVITSGTSTSDTKVYSAKRAGEIFYGKDTVGEIQSGETWSAADDKVATTSAIDARIIDLVDDVGGFVPIANENSFPTTNPDVNNGAGTLVSIKALSEAITTGSGVTSNNSIAQTTGGTAVNITGLTESTTYAAGFGMIVETTTTLNQYTFHRLVPKATEVTTVAGISGNVTTVAGISSNVTTVAGVSSNVTTVAGSITNVNNVGGSIANVNTTASNLTNINNFAEKYQIDDFSPSAPTTDGGGNAVAEGDLAYDTTANALKVYDGSSWQLGVTDTSSLVAKSGDTLTGNLVIDNDKEIRFEEATSNGSAYVGIKGATDKGSEGSYTISLPADAPTAGEVLKANASTPTNLEWGTISGADTTYSVSAVDGDDSASEKIRLTAGGSGSGTDDVVIAVGTGLSIARSSDTITITNTVTDTTLTNEAVQDVVGAMFSGNTETGIAATYEDGDGTIDLVVADTEGTAIKSTGETGTAKFLRVDGDNSCSWQVPPDTTTPADDSVTGAKLDISLVQGDVIYASGTDTLARLAKGSAGEVLKMNSGETAPEWGTAGVSISNDANNRITTADGSAGLVGEANLTFDGTTLAVTGNQTTTLAVAAQGFEAPAEITANWSIAAANNAMFPGPMTVASGVSVTVPANRTLTIV